MSLAAILAPVFVQVALTFALLFWTGLSRVGAVRRGEVKIGSIALGQQNWPPKITQVANSYNSQFQVPALFYALVVLAIVTRQADPLFVIMSWLFVAARLAHAAIHTTSNHVGRRFNAFLAGVLILLAMWVNFAVRIFTNIG